MGDTMEYHSMKMLAEESKIAANLFRYVCEKSATESTARLVGKNMTEHARQLRTAAQERNA